MINGRKDHTLVQPLIFGLLPNKKGKTYRRFLKAVKKICKGKFLPKRWGVDFEWGMIKAIEKEIGPLVFAAYGVQLEIDGCYFHWKFVSFMLALGISPFFWCQ